MKSARSFSLALLLAVSACAVPSPAQRKVLDSMIGRSETDLLRTFGVPSRSFNADGHLFLAYVQDESSYFPGSPGFGYGGFGYGGFGGFGGFGYGGGFGGFGPYGYGGGFGGFGPSYYQSSCTTTFEVTGSKVAAWNVRGDGC